MFILCIESVRREVFGAKVTVKGRGQDMKRGSCVGRVIEVCRIVYEKNNKNRGGV